MPSYKQLLILAGSLVLLVTLSGCSKEGETSSHTAPIQDPTSAGARLLKEYCSECHAPPSPNLHTAKEWKSVVARMQEHRVDIALARLPEDKELILLDYLVKYSADKK
ncbi:MAG: Uncharacterized protein FD130_886 [Halothiobacillaceae bacterium]|nr:MAG: Uncharacterized protein FD130_886 [Halothiobacillaceae bacterium]